MPHLAQALAPQEAPQEASQEAPQEEPFLQFPQEDPPVVAQEARANVPMADSVNRMALMKLLVPPGSR